MSLIVISGHARAGKDTLAGILKANFKENYYTMAYADALKRLCGNAFDLSREQLYGDLKEVPDGRYIKTNGTYWTPREILQHMGTEAFRAIDDLFWIKQLFKYIDRNNLNNVIITDGRFPDEINVVKNRGGIHIRISREDEGAAQGKDHASETSLDNFNGDIDFDIKNNGSITELKVMANKIIKEIENGK